MDDPAEFLHPTRKLVAENHDFELLELLRAAAEQDEREDASEGEVDEPGEQSRPPCWGKSVRLYEDLVSVCSLGDAQSLSRSREGDRVCAPHTQTLLRWHREL